MTLGCTSRFGFDRTYGRVRFFGEKMGSGENLPRGKYLPSARGKFRWRSTYSLDTDPLFFFWPKGVALRKKLAEAHTAGCLGLGPFGAKR